jgi:hypothetical protein
VAGRDSNIETPLGVEHINLAPRPSAKLNPERAQDGANLQESTLVSSDQGRAKLLSVQGSASVENHNSLQASAFHQRSADLDFGNGQGLRVNEAIHDFSTTPTQGI